MKTIRLLNFNLIISPCNLSSYDYIEAGIKIKNSPSGQKISVREIVNHPLYNSMKLDNDVAILKLKLSLNFNENVQSACLPDPFFAPEESGEYAIVSGWGTTSEGNFMYELLLLI